MKLQISSVNFGYNSLSRYSEVFSVLIMAQSKPSYEDDDYKWINHKDKIYRNIFNLWPDDGLMQHKKAEEEAILFTGSNYPGNNYGNRNQQEYTSLSDTDSFMITSRRHNKIWYCLIYKKKESELFGERNAMVQSRAEWLTRHYGTKHLMVWLKVLISFMSEHISCALLHALVWEQFMIHLSEN